MSSREHSQGTTPTMSADGLTLAYAQNAAPTISTFTHTFAPGSITCLLAPSGTGKTTLLRAFAGQLPPLRGTLQGFPPHAGMVFQETRLFEDATALENCLLIAGAHASTAAEQLLAELIDPASVHKPVHELSGGMKRRVELARALLAASPVLILDEPFTGLDDATRHHVCEVLLRHQKGRTIIMSTHSHSNVADLGAEALVLSCD
jgi:ABC-type multidrug transport system ATPase subunit